MRFKKRLRWKIICLDKVYNFLLEHFLTRYIFYVYELHNLFYWKCSFNGYKVKKTSAKREYYDEDVFLKADRALSKLNFLFYSNSKTNLVTLRKCNSHLQYYKIDLSFNIKKQEINLNLCDEYKTERETRRWNRARKLAYKTICALWESDRKAVRFLYYFKKYRCKTKRILFPNNFCYTKNEINNFGQFWYEVHHLFFPIFDKFG